MSSYSSCCCPSHHMICRVLSIFCCGYSTECCTDCASADDLYQIAENYRSDAYNNTGSNSAVAKRARNLAAKFFQEAEEKGHQGAIGAIARMDEQLRWKISTDLKNIKEVTERSKQRWDQEYAEKREFEAQHPEVPILKEISSKLDYQRF